MRVRVRPALPMVCLLLAVSSAAAQTWIPVEYPGATSTLAFGVNQKGDVAGIYFTDTVHGFLFSNGAYQAIDYPGASRTWCRGLSDKGEIAGTFDNGSDTPQHGFLLSRGAFLQIDFPGAKSTNARAITGSVVVGDYWDAAGTQHGFVLAGVGGRAPTFTTVDYPDATQTAVTGVNASGDVVGVYTGAGQHGFLRSAAGSLQTIDGPPGYGIGFGGLSINAKGVIVGSYYSYSGVSGFVLADGVYTSYDYPGVNQTNFLSISKKGLIAGFENDGSVSRGFVLAP